MGVCPAPLEAGKSPVVAVVEERFKFWCRLVPRLIDARKLPARTRIKHDSRFDECKQEFAKWRKLPTMLSRTEMVWRHLLVGAFDLGVRRSSLTQLSEELNLPVSTIHKALERPRAIGAVRGSASGLRVLDPKRLQQLWAALRDLNSDVVYSTKVPMAVNEIEARLPISAIPTAYTAFVQHEGRNLVADYEQVLVYADANEVKRRFPSRPGPANLLVFEPDPLLSRYGKVAPRCQVYTDLFNLPTWQAQRFLEALDRKLLRDVA